MVYGLRKFVRPVALGLLINVAIVSVFPETGVADEPNHRQLFTATIKPFLETHCLGCHGGAEAAAGVRLDGLTDLAVDDRHLWTLIHKQLATDAMPPEDQPRPKQHVSASIQQALLDWQAATRPTGVRRLNRREISAALQDLTGLVVNYADQLPADGKVAGFDTGAAALQDVADSIDSFLQLTRRVVAPLEFSAVTAQAHSLKADLRNLRDPRKAFDPWKAFGVSAKVRGVMLPGRGLLIEPKWLGERGGMTFYLPAPQSGLDVLELSLTVSSFKGDFAAVPPPHLWVQVGGKTLEILEIPFAGDNDESITLTYHVQLAGVPIEKKGLAITLHNKVEMPYAVPGFDNDDRTKPEDNVPGGGGLFRPAWDRKAKLPPAKKPIPYVVLESMTITPQKKTLWPPADWGVPVAENASDQQRAERLLKLWMTRAWRRPIHPDEPQRFLSLFKRLQSQGMSFDDSLRATFQAVLMSPAFRFLPGWPNDGKETASTSDDFALATRLSFFLTGTPADAELQQLAAGGTLRDPAVLRPQVERLLSGNRSQRILTPFVEQWLELGQPITIAMDHLKKQDFRFGRFLKESLHNETLMYFRRIVRENRPAAQLLDSNWTMMNNSLARHYGYTGVTSAKLRPVKLRADDPRGGGLLSHAGIQSMLCWMGDNWVIYRGAWTLRHVLDDPPPPPPLEVPELDATSGENRGRTFRELLQQHQADQNCAVCHRKMDPLGFAFQNFDLSGRWRTVEFESYKRAELDGKIEWRGTGKSRPVDASGQLPRGERFRTFAECKKLLVRHYQRDFIRGLLKNWVLFGRGHRADIQDLQVIERLLDARQADGYPTRDLLADLICSPVFLGRERTSR